MVEGKMARDSTAIGSLRLAAAQGERMQTPEEVAAMLRLHGLGWGSRRIAAQLGCSRTTVKRYVAAAGWLPYRRPGRPRKLAGRTAWLQERLIRHRGNADVVRQDLERELGITVTLRTLEREVAPLRQALAAEARATLRFETPPGRQLQIDFGETRVAIGVAVVKLHLFVATLGYSRRLFVHPFGHQRQSAWFDGLEAAFRHFGGVPRELLVDNPRALVDHHDAATREVRFNARFAAFCRHWDVCPRACAPYRARTKGKDERGVGYVKRNAIAGHDFPSWAALEAHLARWMRTVADVRRHGTTEEAPAERFAREEATALRPLSGRPAFNQVRELVRTVTSECTIELDANSYSVPWRLIGARVQVVVGGGRVHIRHAGSTVAAHAEVAGRRQRVIDPAHFHGISGLAPPARLTEPPAPALLRPLAEYERAVDGGWS
jgi:transposase